MAVDYTTTGLIAAIKLRGILPSSQTLYNAANMVTMMSKQLIADIVPAIMETKQEYLVQNYDQSISANQVSFFIPFRAVGLKLRDCVLVDSAGKEYPLRRFEPEDLKEGFDQGVKGFYVDNDKVNLIPSGNDYSQYTFRAKIFRRPNYLVQASGAAQITTIDTATKTVTCSSVPSSFTTSLTYDFIKGKPSFRVHAEEQALSVKNGFDLTFSAALPSDLAVGDWVAETGFSPIPQIPYDLHPLLEQSTVILILRGLKDRTGVELAEAEYKKMLQKFGLVVNPRVDGAPQKIVSRRGIGAFSRGGPSGGW